MLTFSRKFGIKKSQAELDFVDVPLSTDIPLFIDPFAISQRLDRWSQECNRTLMSFFQRVVDTIRSGDHSEARALLLHLREPNETRLGLSTHRPQGAGIGTLQAEQVYKALRDSAAVKEGFLSALEECELMIEGIGRDKISDLTTNVIRSHLVDYTADQCELHGVPRQTVALPPCFNPNLMQWEARYAELPVADKHPILLVPKAIVRFDPAYEYRRYYRHFVLNFLQAEALDAAWALVRTLKNGKRVVYKKDLERQFPCTKDFLYRFSRKHPQVLHHYRETLRKLEKDRRAEIGPEDQGKVAGALARSLQSINPGDVQAQEYHNLMVGIVEFLFFPQLLYPKKEREIHEGRKRIDIIMENGARGGIFYRLHDVRKLPCAYVAFECKNYVNEVGNPELDQLAGRFSVNRGKLGFLCCRHFEDRSLFVQRCRDTLTDDRGLIIPLQDDTVLRLLGMIERGKRAEIESEISNLVDDVWLS